ncbi:Thyrotropin-releasing hormone receptor [Pteropus alecto]|uniref:Thyrotropin-releasing hormone receptor n=1 Tax=Pteropus alecto TaxID=9402 RepID=L5JP11_PTEAL|nr:Thyrotropin-releasing hormone receptor [Pteropus alecto]
MVDTVGITIVILVVLTMRDMHTPTDCYLMELVAKELPNVSDSVAGQWVYGHANCLDIINLEYLGINVSFCSIPAVTGERSIHCLLWLFLVDLTISETQGLECGYEVSCSLYLSIYFAVFFIVPLLVVTILYGLIGTILTHHGGVAGGRNQGGAAPQTRQGQSGTAAPSPKASYLPGNSKHFLRQEPWLHLPVAFAWPQPSGVLGPSGFPSPALPQVTKMLVVIVLLFALLWMLYHTLVPLNSFMAQPFLDPWVLLFYRTYVYINSAISPTIYSLTFHKFQVACQRGAAEVHSLPHHQQ